MRHKEVIYLGSKTITEDDFNNEVENFDWRKVYANEYSISSNEFYNAAVNGLRPEKRFEIYSFEYNGEEKLKHDGTVYNIIRTEKKGEKTRITCEEVTGDA